MLIDRYGSAQPDHWHVHLPGPSAGEQAEKLQGNVLLDVESWRGHRNRLIPQIHSGHIHVGIELTGDDIPLPPDIMSDLSLIQHVAVHFTGFADGRGYSLGFQLRVHHGYSRSLRAIGVKADNLAQLVRCGFDSYLLEDGQDARLAQELLGDPASAISAPEVS